MFVAALFIISLICGITAVLNYIGGQEVALIHWIFGLPGLIAFVLAIPFALTSDR